jgi:hypothetical protein
MTKAFSLLLAAAVALTAVPTAAKTSKQVKHKTRVTHVARQTAPAYHGTDKFPAGPLYYNGGTYLGDDPDPFIRSQIWRDIGATFGGPD